jgi:hypothetical protein
MGTRLRLQWCQELNNYCPGTPIILVGTKSDLRDEPGVIEKLREQRLEPVSSEQGRAVAQRIKAIKYLECRSVEPLLLSPPLSILAICFIGECGGNFSFSLSLSLPLSLSVCLPVCLPVCLSVCLPLCLPVWSGRSALTQSLTHPPPCSLLVQCHDTERAQGCF